MNVTDVCNMALSSLGKGRIVSVDEQSEQARQCKLFYDVTKRRLLRDYNWGFAKRVERLAELETVNPFWRCVYAYPEKCESVRNIFSCTEYRDGNGGTKQRAVPKFSGEDKDKYEVYMVSDNVRGIACNVDDAWMEYTYDIDDLNVCSSDFVEALAHLLASNIAIALTGNAGLKTSEYNLAQVILNRAKYTSANEAQHTPERPSGYFGARM